MRPEGDIVAGKYRIDRLLGAGAMGTVYTAHHILLREKVAIKFLRPEAIGHAESVSRFVREARAVVQIQSEHVVRVRDVDIEDGRPYIVMDHLEGCDLAALLREKGRLPVDQAVDFIVQTCDAIAKAHELGIIHRDLKPANIFVVRRAGGELSIKVLDFGISKTTGLVSDTLAPEDDPLSAIVTEEKVIIGSPFYMSPEQMESARDVDERTDIWALGVTLCQLITGRLPFDGTNLMQVFSQATSDRPLRLRESSPHLSPGHEAVILKCLQRERENRYGSVRELIAALAELGSSRAASLAPQNARRSPHSVTGTLNGAVEEPSVGAGTLHSQITPTPLVATVPEAGSVRRRRALALVALVAVTGLVVSKAIAREGAAAEERAKSARVDSAPPIVLSAPERVMSGGPLPTATGDRAVAVPATAIWAGPAIASRMPPPSGEGVRPPTLTAKATPAAMPQPPIAMTMATTTATTMMTTSSVPNPIPTVLGGRK